MISAHQILIFVFIIISLVTNVKTVLEEPKFDNLKSDGFHGLVKENERTVVVSPRIKISNAEVCAIELLFPDGQDNRRAEIPFEVRIVDRAKGEALIEAKKQLNCEQRRSYKFEMRALACNGLRSKNATIILTVEDVNEFPPVFHQNSYSASVNEGKLYSSIVRLQAADQDCSAKYSEICKFEIIGGDNPVSPFVVDSAGNLANTRPLSTLDSANYILEVVAYDCGMKRSKPALVNIKVNKVCESGWQSSSFTKSSQRIEYIPNSGNRILFPDAQLQLCNSCEINNVSVKVSLAAGHIGKGCDRDTYSVQSQRKLCDAHSEGIDLLPSSQVEWTRNLLQDQGHDSDAIFLFKGAQHAQYPASLKPNLGTNLSVSFWMQHSNSNDQIHNKHLKEHVICLADDHKKNRHHFSVFIRNCRLILLLRKEYSVESHKVFRPAEWRWKLKEVCDNRWHHYAINVQFPDVELYIDGNRFKNTSSIPEIVDDWPLHKLPNVNTSLVVGACLAGSDGSYRHHFNGYLAGLSLINSAIERSEVIRCMVQCKENIGLSADLNELDTLTIKTAENDFDKQEISNDENLNVRLGKIINRMSSSLNNDQEEIGSDETELHMNIQQNQDGQHLLIKSKSIIQLEDALSQIYYKNDREFPTPGRRNLKISTSIKCKSSEKIKIPDVESYIMVLPPEQLSIILNGTTNLAREYDAFMQGIPLFSTLNLLINHEQSEESIPKINEQTFTTILDDQITSASIKSNVEPDIDENLIDSDLNSENISGSDSEDDINSVLYTEKNNLSTNNKKQVYSKLMNAPKLDTCTVQVYPPLNPDHEYFRLPTNYMNYLNVNYKQTQDGLIIYGIDTVHSYEQILREIIYFNRKPAYYLNRAFKLTCSELNGRFLSNDYIQTLAVIHPKVTNTNSYEQHDKLAKASKINVSNNEKILKNKLITQKMKEEGKKLASDQQKKLIKKHNEENLAYSNKVLITNKQPLQSKIQTHQHRVQIKEAKVKNSDFTDSGLMEESFARAPASHAVTAIIVVCVSFLVFMIALGVIRIRAAHNKADTRDEGQEMVWDDTSLSITVNPLDKMNQILANEASHINDDEDDFVSSDDNSSFSNGESSDDDEQEVKTIHPSRRDLEWDDSTMNF